MDNFDLRKYLAEGKLRENNISLSQYKIEGRRAGVEAAREFAEYPVTNEPDFTAYFEGFKAGIFDYFGDTAADLFSNAGNAPDELEEDEMQESYDNVTKEDWVKMDRDDREFALLSAFKDPEDAWKYIDSAWEDLPSVATSNMVK